MSVNLMSLVFNCNMPELKTDEGQTVPDTTAKFVLLALADNANDEGEGAYPGVDTLCRKTNYSTSTVCNALNALRVKKFVVLVGKSKRDTNNYTVSAARILAFQWPKRDDSSHRNDSVSATETNPSSPSPNHPPKKDLVDGLFELYSMPGAKKVIVKQYIASQIKIRLTMNPSGKDAETFINYAADRKIKDNQDINKFLDWWIVNFKDRAYWTFRKMEQQWPAAFVAPQANPVIPEPPRSIPAAWQKIYDETPS